jgi:RNA polymerase sigma factor (sigma-70 family)
VRKRGTTAVGLAGSGRGSAPAVGDKEEAKTHRKVFSRRDGFDGNNALIARAQAGGADGKAAMDELVGLNMGLIYSCTRRAVGERVRSRGEVDEFISVGVMAFMRAVLRIDLSRQTRLSTYAKVVIERDVRGAMLEDLTVRVPDHRARWRDYERLEAARMISRRTVSLGAVVRGTDSVRMGDAIGHDGGKAQEEMFEELHRREAAGLVRGRMHERLDARERTVVQMRMRGSTLEDVRAEVGVSKERVRQMQEKALRVLREGGERNA